MGAKKKRPRHQSAWKRFKSAALGILKDLEHIARKALPLMFTIATTLVVLRLILMPEMNRLFFCHLATAAGMIIG